jgi:hypothetical protein
MNLAIVVIWCQFVIHYLQLRLTGTNVGGILTIQQIFEDYNKMNERCKPLIKQFDRDRIIFGTDAKQELRDDF